MLLPVTSLASFRTRPTPSIPHTTVEATPLTAVIGSEVHGLDLARPLEPGTAAALAELLAERQVLFFRGQSLDDTTQRALAEQFGPISRSPLQELLGIERGCSVIEDSAERPPADFDWHTDLSWTDRPPRIGILHALVIPPVGGDTLWASGFAAYDGLTDELQALARSLRVTHRMDATYLRTVARHHGAETAERLRAAHPPVAHPLVRSHPVTGRPALWMSSLYQDRIVGHDRTTSDRLLDLFGAALRHPAAQVRWRWAVGDVVIWDETSTCHRALADHIPALRRMRRCTVEGDRPRLDVTSRAA